MKKFLSLFLIVILLLSCFSTSVAFAEESESVIPENATRHTIEITLQPEEECDVTPYVWGDPSMSIIDNHSAYTSSFYLSDKYFAYEMEGYLEGNPTTSDKYSVSLEYSAGGVLANMSGYADGTIYKLDWITINTDGNYRFKVTNSTDYVLSVFITYYSWN